MVVGTLYSFIVEDKQHLCLFFFTNHKNMTSNFRYLAQDSFCIQHFLRKKHRKWDNVMNQLLEASSTLLYMYTASEFYSDNLDLH